jgi:hypothetical protein
VLPVVARLSAVPGGLCVIVVVPDMGRVRGRKKCLQLACEA